MPPYVSSAFTFHGRKSNQLFEHEIISMLCPKAEKENAKRLFALELGMNTDGQSAETSHNFSFTKSSDGNKIVLDSKIRIGDKNFKTQLEALRVKDNIFEITTLVFDNKTEPLICRQHIYNVLEYIGQKQLLVTAEGGVAEPHQEKGRFGKIGRFLARCIPDDPQAWAM